MVKFNIHIIYTAEIKLKRTIAFLLTLCMLLGLCGCSSGGISTFTVPVSKMPTCLDPQTATAETDLLVLTNIFDGLFEKQNGKIVNNVATDCVISPDGRKYTITIREDSFFHCKTDKEEKYDGKPVTAEDFVFGISRVLLPETKSPYAADFINIKGAEEVLAGGDLSGLGIYAPNEKTIVIELDKPDFNFKEKLCLAAAFPCDKEFFESTKGSYGLSVNNILSNGPFKLNYMDAEQATIVKTTEKAGGLDRIRLLLLTDSSAENLYKDGKISGFFSYGNKTEAYQSTDAVSFESDIIYLTFNTDNSYLSNSKIRQALSYYAFAFENSGANKDAVIPAYSIFPNILTYDGKYLSELLADKTPSYMNQNPKDLLTAGESEVNAAKSAGLSVLIPSDSYYKPVFDNINQIWQKDLNLYFTVEYLTVSEIQSRVENKDFDIAFLPMSAKSDSVYSVLDKFTRVDGNLSEIVIKSKSLSNPSEAIKYVSAAEDIILENAYLTPVAGENTTFYCDSAFKNIIIDPFTKVINLKYVSVR